MINVFIQDLVNKKNKITAPFCKQLFQHAWSQDAEITIRIVSLEESQELNKTFRGKNSPTNVLSFIISDEPYLFGDLVLCHDVIKQEAKLYNKKILSHYAHLVLHGFLHLIGYNHENMKDQKIMESLEIDILKKIKIDNPYE